MPHEPPPDGDDAMDALAEQKALLRALAEVDAEFAASRSSLASSIPIEKGFSQKTCFPSAIACRATSL